MSDLFDLGVEQGALDFVDVIVAGDVPVYIDPTAIRVQSGAWVEQCQIQIRSYFEELLAAIRQNDVRAIRALVVPLSEPNETHLGQSKGRARGRSLGSRKKADELVAALRRSKAIHSGLIEDLEDSVLFVDGIGADILSDIATCVIRRQLVEYTQNQAAFWGIPLVEQATVWWDSDERSWDSVFVELPRGPQGTLLLVPKSIVRLRPSFEKGEYYRGYLRPFFEEEELAKGLASEYVRMIRKGTKRQRLKVSKGELGKDLGTDKASIAKNSEIYPAAIEKYRADKRVEANAPIPADVLSVRTSTPPADLRELLSEVKAIRTGPAGANAYHRAVAALLTALFGGSLGNQRLEKGIHDGLKRIDIVFDNVAGEGFFRWLSLNYRAASIVIECKNYTADPANPELDQIAMRFSPNRGMIGFLVCRQFDNKARFQARCASAARDGHGFVIALDDDDLRELVEAADRPDLPGAINQEYPLIRERFDHLIGA